MTNVEDDCDFCHNKREVLDRDLKGYHETAPCPKCRDGSWAYKALNSWFNKFHALAGTETKDPAILAEREKLNRPANQEISTASSFLTVGDLRKLISSLSDDAPILYETNDETLLTWKLRQAAIKRAHDFELETMNFDLSYFDNDVEGSKPVLVICAHEGKLKNYSTQNAGPGCWVSTPMKQIGSS